MKKILTILLLIVATAAYAQPIKKIINVVGTGSTGSNVGDSLVYLYANTVKNADTSGMLQKYRDSLFGISLRTANNSTAINTNTTVILGKVAYADTSGMLQKYRDSLFDYNVRLLGNTSNIATNTTAVATKQAQLSGTGFVKASGTTISYDNTTYKAANDSAGNAGYTTLFQLNKSKDSIVNLFKQTKQGDTVTATIANAAGNIWYRINPNVVVTAITVTMPATPIDGQIITFNFGGILNATGTPVVNTLTIAPNTSQGIVGAAVFYSVETDDGIRYRYDSSNSKWYRQ